MESDDVIIIERKLTQIIHVDPRLTMTTAEEHSLNTLTNNLKNKRLNQYEVDKAFSTAASSNFRCTMDFLLMPREGQLSPSQCRINDVLWSGVITDNWFIVNYLTNLSEQYFRPDQWGMNEALWQATIYNKPAIVELLLNASNVKLRPDKNGIGHAYAKAKQLNFFMIADLLGHCIAKET